MRLVHLHMTNMSSFAELTVSKALDWVADIVGKQASLYSRLSSYTH